jgi:hypothetical protein
MDRRRLAIIGVTVALGALGAGAAIGATSSDPASRAEQAVLADAAERLDTTPQALRQALTDAIDAELDRAVRDGRLTRERADAIKAYRQGQERVLAMPGSGPGARGGPLRRMDTGRPLGARPLSAVADALGLTEREMFQRLHRGRSVGQIARAQGTSLAEVRAKVRDAMEQRLDRAVDDGRLARGQAEAMLEHLEAHLERLGSRPMMGTGRGARGFHRGFGSRGRGFGRPPAPWAAP